MILIFIPIDFESLLIKRVIEGKINLNPNSFLLECLIYLIDVCEI